MPIEILTPFFFVLQTGLKSFARAHYSLSWFIPTCSYAHNHKSVGAVSGYRSEIWSYARGAELLLDGHQEG
jgi:hypothetical protein